MLEIYTKGENHGCVVCGKLYHMYVVYDSKERFVDCKVMSLGGKRVQNAERPLVACDKHSEAEIQAALARTYGLQKRDDD
jgi:hypothetical protein